MNGRHVSEAPTNGSILDRLAALGDPIRCRILLVLERHELTVSELCTVLQLPQSTASRHLKVLVDDGWLEARKDGTSRLYSGRPLRPGEPTAQLWDLVRAEMVGGTTAEEDSRRLESVLARRRSKSKEFFTAAATHWAEVRRDLFGRRFDLEALLGLLDPHWVVGDLGAGTGQLAGTLAPYVARVIAVDDSPAMIDAAAKRLAGVANVEIRHGRLESLPCDDESLDVATMVLVLQHLPEPDAALTEAARALAPGGKLLLVDMLPHEREDYRREMGHVWLGFSEDQIAAWLHEAGLRDVRVRQLRPDPEAKGPTLFSATASKPVAKRLEFPVADEASA